MYITKVEKRDRGRKKNFIYLIQYLEIESAEGLSEQFKRFYGLKKVIPGSYFYLGDRKSGGDYDWSVFKLQKFFN